MNVERWIKLRRESWHRLETILSRCEYRGLGSLPKEDLRLLGGLYRSASADLARARALKLSNKTLVYLNNLVVRAHNQVYSRPANSWSKLWHFIIDGFPRVVLQKALYVIAASLVVMVPFWAAFEYVQKDRSFASLHYASGQPLVSEPMLYDIEHRRLWTDDSDKNSPTISAFLATNNIRVAILAFTFGITYGIGTVYVLFKNGIVHGAILGLCRTSGLLDRLLAFIVSHGVLELTAIFIAGGAGILLACSMIFPGQYKRVDSLKLAAKPAMLMFAGCVPLLMLAALIEGFISPRLDIKPDAKVMVGLATLAMLILYLLFPRAKKDESSQDGKV